VSALIEPQLGEWAAGGSENDLVAALVNSEQTVANLRIALTSNREISIAVGIVMHQHKITEATAFSMLQLTSQRSGITLAEVAQQVAHSGADLAQWPTLTIDPN
jgi:hypothetical protein